MASSFLLVAPSLTRSSPSVTIKSACKPVFPRSAAVHSTILSPRRPFHSKNVRPIASSINTGVDDLRTQVSKPNILVAEKLSDQGIELLKAHSDVECAYNLSPEELNSKIKLVDALIVRSATKVTREVFAAAEGRLRVVGRACVGIDNVDVDAATEFGCLVVNAPTGNTIAAAEHAINLLASMARNVAQADASTKSGKWERKNYVGVSLVGKKLAVMGFGKVGSEMAHDPYAPADQVRHFGAKVVSFDSFEEAIRTADFISIHKPLTPATPELFDDEAFSKMKRGVRIINEARCGVDEKALVRALDNGTVAQRADSSNIYEKVTCTPHLGASTAEAQESVAIELAKAVLADRGYCVSGWGIYDEASKLGSRVDADVVNPYISSPNDSEAP